MNYSIILPTKDRHQILHDNLTQLKQAVNLQELEVVIINDSKDPVPIDKNFPFVKVYQNEFGAGVASARNFGASKATHDWLIFMDDDMWVKPDTFVKLEPFTHDPMRCLNVNWLYPEFLQEKRSSVPFLRYLHHYGFDSLEGWSSDVVWNNHDAFKVKGITSQFLLMHKDAFEKVGRYNISFPFAGFEDHDMSLRLKDKGIEVYVDPQNMIYHNEADRIEVESWLERKRRLAITRRVAIHVGHKGLIIHYSFLKKWIYSIAYRLRRPILTLLHNWNKDESLDKIYFLLVNLMLGTYAYTGYTSKQAQDFIEADNAKSRSLV